MQDVQMDSDVADRRRRQQLIATTLDALALERSKVLTRNPSRLQG